MATTNYSWALPTVGGSTDTWGGIINDAFEAVDVQVKAVENSVGLRNLKSDNLSDVADASVARTNLGIEIGADVQAYNLALASIAGLTTAANKGLFLSAENVFETFTLSAAGRSFIGSNDAAAMRTYLSLTGDYGVRGNANTWTDTNNFTGGLTKDGKTVTYVDSGAATNSGKISWGTADPGTLDEGEIYLKVEA